jgi:hypothetical protein
MRKFLLGVAFGLPLICSSQASAAIVMGAGTVSCGAHLANTSDMKSYGISWVLGYLSAIGYHTEDDILRTADAAGIRAAVEKYRDENPLRHLAEAAEHVASELRQMDR